MKGATGSTYLLSGSAEWNGPPEASCGDSACRRALDVCNVYEIFPSQWSASQENNSGTDELRLLVLLTLYRGETPTTTKS